MGKIRGIAVMELGSLGLGVILCWLWGLEPAYSVVLCLAGGVGASAGAWATGRSQGQGICAMVLAVVLASVLGVVMFSGVLQLLITLGVCLLGFGALIASGYGFYGPLGVWSTLIAGAAMFAGKTYGQAWEIGTVISAVSCLLLTMDGFRDSTLRKSQHKNRSFSTIGNPGNIRRHSYVMLGLFLGLGLLLTLFFWGTQALITKGIRALVSEGSGLYSAFIKWLQPLMDAFLAWLKAHLNHKSTEGTLISQNTGGGGDWLQLSYTGSRGATVAMVAVFLGLCGFLALGLGGLLLRRQMKKRETPENTDYEDFVERLEGPSLRRWLKQRHKKQRLRDFDSSAMKIRFIFQQMLGAKLKKDGSAMFKTPNELLSPSTPDEAALVAAYNQVKYGDGSVTEQELAAAERYWKGM